MTHLRDRERQVGQSFNSGGRCFQGAWRVCREMRDEARAMRIQLTGGVMELAFLKTRQALFSIGANRRGDGIGGGITELRNLIMPQAMMFMPEDRHALAHDRIGMSVAREPNRTLLVG